MSQAGQRSYNLAPSDFKRTVMIFPTVIFFNHYFILTQQSSSFIGENQTTTIQSLRAIKKRSHLQSKSTCYPILSTTFKFLHLTMLVMDHEDRGLDQLQRRKEVSAFLL